MLKNLFFVSLLVLSACIKGEVLEEEELKIEFEDIWWELTDIPGWTDQDGQTYCYYFDSDVETEEPNDGNILHFLEGDFLSYVLTEFERTEEGYFVSEYDVYLKIIIKEDGSYSVKGSQGLFSIQSDIIPCSLGL
tara:strand:- start:16 stop:420 length:405 start_codon:yes stop_codon:yes gene_type:complete